MAMKLCGEVACALMNHIQNFEQIIILFSALESVYIHTKCQT